MSEFELTMRCLGSTRIADRDAPQQKEKEKVYSDIDNTPEIVVDRHEDSKEILDEDIGNVGASTEDEIETASTNATEFSDSNFDFESSDGDCLPHKNNPPAPPYTSCIYASKLSADGTCIFTSDYDRALSVYPIPNNILTEPPIPLKPYSRATSPNPIWAFEANPNFNLNDPSSTTVLVSRRDSYITLHNALWDISKQASEHPAPKTGPINTSKAICSYKLINELTEAVTAPLSLAYTHDATHFFAGTDRGISVFDSSRHSGPIQLIRNIPSQRNKLKGGGRGFKGTIAALSLAPLAGPGLLAAGSRTRFIGMYDANSGEEYTSFQLPRTLTGTNSDDSGPSGVIGDGVSSIKWSPCGTYLYVAEVKADCLLIYDVRNFALALGHCAGRKAFTKQKLAFDVWDSSGHGGAGSHEIWAGGTDGCVRVWRDPWAREGAVEADAVNTVGAGDAPVVGTMVHATGSLAVAACGRIKLCDDEGEDGSAPKGRLRKYQDKPRFRDWGSVEIMGLS